VTASPFLKGLKLLGVTDLEQVNVFDIFQVMNAHAARRAPAQLDNPSNGIVPALWIEGAVVDRADGVGKCSSGDSIEPVRCSPLPSRRGLTPFVAS
jgi:hypothetical protein